jgi:ankyrin repeat protein
MNQLFLNAIIADNHMNALSDLISAQGIDVNLPIYHGITPLLLAAANNSMNSITVLLNAGADPDLICEIGAHTPLFVAAMLGRKEMVIKLLEAGAGVNVFSGQYTPIEAAAFRGHVDIVHILLAAGAGIVDPQNNHDNTPFDLLQSAGHLASVQGHDEISRELYSHHFRFQLQLCGPSVC